MLLEHCRGHRSGGCHPKQLQQRTGSSCTAPPHHCTNSPSPRQPSSIATTGEPPRPHSIPASMNTMATIVFFPLGKAKAPPFSHHSMPRTHTCTQWPQHSDAMPLGLGNTYASAPHTHVLATTKPHHGEALFWRIPDGRGRTATMMSFASS
jgi:hypothetical protein